MRPTLLCQLEGTDNPEPTQDEGVLVWVGHPPTVMVPVMSGCTEQK